jgi:DNA-binding transcriptional regulator YbjK
MDVPDVRELRPATAARRARGSQSRLAILDAALRVIARDGLAAANHRAIAAEAGVALASTTYHFDSLPQLHEQAFELYAQRAQPINRQALERARARIEALADPDAGARAALQQRLLGLLVAFLRRQLHEHAGNLAVEVQFLGLVRPEAALARRVGAYRDALVADIAQVLQPLSPQPAIDASLLLGAVHRLELEGLRAGRRLPEARVRAELGRLLALVLGVEAPAPARRRART